MSLGKDVYYNKAKDEMKKMKSLECDCPPVTIMRGLRPT